MKCILIDDESDCLELLSLLISKYCPALSIIGQYQNPQDGIDAIWVHKPDLVFLDIEMPLINGFDVLKACEEVPFQVVFTTGHKHFASEAFRYSATDFLNKPINEIHLQEAVAKAHNKITAQEIMEQREIFLQYLHQEKPLKARIALPTPKGYFFSTINDIIYCEAAGNKTITYIMGESKPTVVLKSLGGLEEMLEPIGFFRAHHSFLVNIYRVKKLLKGDDAGLEMANGNNVPVARAKKNELIRRLGI